jgi:hypothetical protein
MVNEYMQAQTCHRQLNKEDNMKNNARDRLVKSMAKILAELNGHDYHLRLWYLSMNLMPKQS